ncbi:MAG: hypothetical protein GYA87_09885 [Christensenellaceae bacterium]|nr:hypothetical protein [Christensenellaceae bacterium]
MAERPAMMFFFRHYKLIKSTVKDPINIAKMVDMLMTYAQTGEITESGNDVLDGIFEYIKPEIDRDKISYDKKVEQRREAGLKSALKRSKKSKDNLTSVDDSQAITISNTDTKTITTTYSQNFNKFWGAYPKRVGKGAAFVAFKKLKVDDDLLEDILKALKKQCNSHDWKKENGQYIPNPTTYLNQRRWEDVEDISIEYRELTIDEKMDLGLDPFDFLD